MKIEMKIADRLTNKPGWKTYELNTCTDLENETHLLVLSEEQKGTEEEHDVVLILTKETTKVLIKQLERHLDELVD